MIQKGAGPNRLVTSSHCAAPPGGMDTSASGIGNIRIYVAQSISERELLWEKEPKVVR
jgi:hypothetical protein